MNIYQKYISLGLSCIPCIDKKPTIPWKAFQTCLPTPGIAEKWEAAQVAIVCGSVSGGLLCIDFDIKNGNRYNDWIMLINNQYPELLSKLVIEKSPSGGYHVIFRSNLSIKNIKLAVNKAGFCTIETRGEGGYFVCNPSPNYTIEYGNFENIQKLTTDETEIVLSVAKSFNEKTIEIDYPKTENTNGGLTPFDDYDLKTGNVDVENVLVCHGWKTIFKYKDKIYFQRPDKTGRGISATWNVIPNRFYVFSTSTIFKNETVYKPSAIYTILEKNGDYREAAKTLFRLGYGKKPEEKERATTNKQKICLLDTNKIRAKIYDILEYGYPRGKSTGWKKLDKFYSVVKGQFTVIHGVPSSGKSEFMDALAINLAKIDEWKFVVFSPENYPVEMHYHKLIEKICGIELRNIQKSEIDSAINFIDSHFYFIDALEEDINLDYILEQSQELIKLKKIDSLIIDPWNEIELSRPKDLGESDYIGQCLRKLRKFARKNNIHLFIIAHPTKLIRGKDGKYPIPELYDIQGSSHWRNKSDNGICIHRDYENNLTSVYIQKIKFRYCGKPGEVLFKYDSINGKYFEVDDVF